MASASWNDHEPVPAVPVPQAAGKRWGRVFLQIWWTSVPIWSFSLLSCVPFLAFAVIQRRKRDWAVFAGYLLATVALVATGVLVNPNSDAAAEALGAFMVVLAGCAAIHTCILFRPGRAQPALAAARRRNQEAVRGARVRMERRSKRGAWFRRIRRWPESSGSVVPTCRGSTTTAAWWISTACPATCLRPR